MPPDIHLQSIDGYRNKVEKCKWWPRPGDVDDCPHIVDSFITVWISSPHNPLNTQYSRVVKFCTQVEKVSSAPSLITSRHYIYTHTPGSDLLRVKIISW